MNNMNISVSDINKLITIYEAVCGLVSETGSEEFDQFYPGGGAKMMNDFTDVLLDLGVKFG